MKRPIPFSATLFPAILTGRKTQARVIIDPQPIDRNSGGLSRSWQFRPPSDEKSLWPNTQDWIPSICPYGLPGDIIFACDACKTGECHANCTEKVALKVISIKVERLQEISNSDAKAEGLPYAYPHRHGVEGLAQKYCGEIIKDPYASNHNTGINDCWICAFRMLTCAHQGLRTWSSEGNFWYDNPWVWVVEFELLKQ